MNLWLIAATALLPGLIPCLVVMMASARPIEWFIAAQLAGNLLVLEFVLLAYGLQRPAFADLGLILALLSFPSGFLFTHFLERWFP